MRKFIRGVVVAVIIVVLGGLAFLWLGYMPTNADANPSVIERRIAMLALDASIERHAPRLSNPVAPTDDNIIEGMKIYGMNCSTCHGTLDLKPSLLQKSFYPPPPQILIHPLDDPEWHIFYAIQRGIRYTGMPAWSQALSDQDLWKVTSLLSRVEKLSPGVRDYWKQSFGVVPAQEASHP